MELTQARTRSSQQRWLPDQANGVPREQLATGLAELIGCGQTLGLDGVVRDLRAAQRRLLEDRFNLVVLGEFKRGKSTLVNALLERELLPTGVLPLTSVVTVIAAGERERLLVRFDDGREQEATLGELAGYVTESANPGNRLGVELVRVEVEHEPVGEGLDLVDTPGVGSIHTHNTQAAHDFLAQVDAALFVLDAGQPFSLVERELVRVVTQRVPRVILAVNKIDRLDARDRRAALEFIEQAAEQVSGIEPAAVFAVSAREGEGVAALRRRLRRLASEERTGTLARSLAGIAAAAAAEIAQSARLEARATELPVQALRQRTEMFRARIVELRAAGVEATTLLDRGLERALEQLLDEPLEGYARSEEARLRGELLAHSHLIGPMRPRQLARELGEWIDARIRDEFAEMLRRCESTLTTQLVSLERSYATRVREILEGVQAAASDVLDAGDLMGPPQLALREPTSFSFKLADPENTLDLIVGRLRTLVPGRLGRDLLVADAEQRLLDMTDRHAGRLRSELHQRAQAAVREYSRELAASVETAIGVITAALERASAQHSRDEASTRQRLEQLARVGECCEALASQLRYVDASPE